MDESQRQSMSEKIAGAAEHSIAVERIMRASPEDIYDAWINRFDTWFASPGDIAMIPSVGQPYWFSVYHEGEHHAHYGRFLALEAGRLIEQTWVSGRNGTDGAETILRVELAVLESGAHLRLSHRGFYDETAARNHGSSWPQILEHLDATLTRDV